MSNDKNYCLNALRLQGAPYEIGHQLGRFGAPSVHSHLLNSKAWATVQQWKNSAAASHMTDLTRHHFPAIWTELRGLADGLELPLDDVFLWNARGDLWAMAPDGCTTIMTPGREYQRITHNEDGDPGFAGQCAIAQCQVEGGVDFASFVYPGSLPGHTLAVNTHGLAMTVNNIRALAVSPGLPRMVVARAILDTPDASSAVALLRGLPLAGAFHLNLADAPSQSLLSVEYSGHYVSVLPISKASLHANHAIHPATRDYPQIITGTSGLRQVQGTALAKQAGRDPLHILSDQTHSDYPIFRRSSDDSDNENTLATADLYLHPGHVQWRVYEDPSRAATFELHNAKLL